MSDIDPRDALVTPHDEEAEGSVIGALLLDEHAIEEALDHVQPEDFYREHLGKAYKAATELFGEGVKIDNVSLAARLESAGVLDIFGGRTRLAMLQESVESAVNIAYYARRVHGLANKRRVIAAGQKLVKLGYDAALEPEQVVDRAQAEVYAIDDEQARGGLEAMAESIGPAMKRVDTLMSSPGIVGIPSGFHEVDRMTNGWQPANLYIVAGATSMGKSAWLVNVANEAALRQRRAVAIFSLEMSREQIVERMLCQEATVDLQRVHKGQISDAEYERLTQAAGPLGDAPLYIDDTPRLDELALALQLRRAKGHDVELVIVDYLQLMEYRADPRANTVAKVSGISRALKAIAREFHVPVIAGSQLSRAPAQRPDKRPVLSDLRESGSIEQDSDAVLFLYRDAYYNKDSEKQDIAEVILAKNRQGPTGSVELLFKRHLTRFENLDRRRQPEQASA